MGFVNFAEMLAAKAGKSAPEIEESLAQKAALSEEARMLKLARETEYNKALGIDNNPPAPALDVLEAPKRVFPSSVEPMSVEPRSSLQAPEAVSSPDLASPKAPNLSQADIDNFMAGQKASGADPTSLSRPYSLANNPKAALAGAAGLTGTGMLMMGGPGSPPTGPVSIDSPRTPTTNAEKPVDPTQETPEETEQKSSFKRIMSMLSPSKREVLDLTGLTGSSLGGDDQLKAAMHDRDRNRMGNDIAKAGQLMGSSMSGTDYDKTGGSLLEEQGKIVDQPVKDLQARVENQENDPKSTASMAMRGMAMKMGFKFADNVSAADIKKQIPQMTSLQNHADTVDAMKANKAMALMAMSEKNKDKISEKDQTLMFKLNDKMNSPEMGSSRAALGKAALISGQADRIKALIASEPNPDNLTGRQAFEVAKALDSMLSSGSSTISGTEHLMPKTLMAEIARGGEYIQNKPIGAKLGKFIKQMEHLVDREKQVSQHQIDVSKDKLLAGLPADFRHRNKADLDNLMQVHAKAAAGGGVSIAPDAPPMGSNEVARKTPDGRTAIFDATTKQFIRYQ